MKFFYMCVLLALVATLCLSPVAGQPSVLTRFKRQASINHGNCPKYTTRVGNLCVPNEKYMKSKGKDSYPDDYDSNDDHY